MSSGYSLATPKYPELYTPDPPTGRPGLMESQRQENPGPSGTVSGYIYHEGTTIAAPMHHPDDEVNNRVTVAAETLTLAVDGLLQYFIDEEGMWINNQIGRELRFGEYDELGVLDEIPTECQVVDSPGLDIFGQPVSKSTKTNYECECPKCKRTLAAARFAQHLEKCMGMGRNSSRIASRRLAAAASNNSASSSSASSAAAASAPEPKASASSQASSSSSASTNQAAEHLGTDDEHFTEDDDEDWTMEKKKKTKKGAEKGTPKRKGPVGRVKTTESNKRKAGSPSVSVAASPLATETTLSLDDDFNINSLLMSHSSH